MLRCCVLENKDYLNNKINYTVTYITSKIFLGETNEINHV